MPITFHNADIKFRLPHSGELKKFIEQQAMKVSGKKLRLTYVFCSDEYLLNINRKFLKHDFYTDIITFPLNETEKLIEAEIYISIERVKDNAKKLKLDFNNELQRVIFHGAFHLLGYKDKTKSQKLIMRKMENEWIKAYSIVH